jgi:hypothetical protein
MQYDCNYCTNLVEEDMWELINLCSKPSSSIHDKGPQICTRSYTAYIQAIFIALLHVLSQPCISNIIVVPAVPVLVSSHWLKQHHLRPSDTHTSDSDYWIRFMRLQRKSLFTAQTNLCPTISMIHTHSSDHKPVQLKQILHWPPQGQIPSCRAYPFTLQGVWKSCSRPYLHAKRNPYYSFLQMN